MTEFMLSWCTVKWMVFVEQKTAYEMRISDWSSDVCSSDLPLWISDGAESARRGMNRACRIHARAFAKLIHRGNSSPPTRSIIAFFRGFPPWRRDGPDSPSPPIRIHGRDARKSRQEIGRASCKERVIETV